MKRFICLIVALTSSFTFLGCLNQNKNQQWYFKRKGNGETSCPYTDSFLSRTNSYWRENTAEKRIYLTFDVGYMNENVLKILDVLKEEEVPAAFFILGHPLLKNTDTVKRMKEDGHLVCNHTKNHKDISNLSKEEITKNLTDLEKLFEEKTGYLLDKFFRPPEGKFSEESLIYIKEMGYKNIFWSYAYADWDDHNQMSPKKALSKLKENLHSGEILLLHPTSKTNAEIIKDFILYAKEEGYVFLSLTNLN